MFIRKEDPRRRIFDESNWKTEHVMVGGHEKQIRDEDFDLYLKRIDKRTIQSRVGSYKRNAEKTLDNVCDGVFP